jgi:hypothetical protein
MTLCSAYLPDDRPGPGRLSEVPLEVLAAGPAELVLPEATIRDERGGDLLDRGLLSDPSGGGGPLSSAERDRAARAFGLVNVAFHTQRALRLVTGLLGRPLPHLVVRIGMHDDGRRWGGGHYRLPARTYDTVEPTDVHAHGEVHLGGGNGFLPAGNGETYFAAPSHNLAIIYHEIGHHVCRHTADFRLNRQRWSHAQTNKKVAVDEGTCDLLTAVLLDSSDIYCWHRGSVPTWDRRRRLLDGRWTMTNFRGGRSDPHADGTIWASACWTARERVAEAGYDRSRFDRMLLRGLSLSAVEAGVGLGVSARTGVRPDTDVTEQTLRRRRHFGALLEAMLRADPGLAGPVLVGMAEHGIAPGSTNAELREAARAHLLVAVGG